ncbi:MAG: hypothetical protein IPP10_15775 [Candidatus Competibacteraceae bacterium]|nr:hypothetical protein [Candidatus Competibacteraceae bacterium]
MLRGCTIARFSDLAGLSRSDVEAIKAFISRKSDRFRENTPATPKDHRASHLSPRPTRIAGSCAIRPATAAGGPITLTAPIDTDRLQAALPQLLGEAAKQVLDGEPWHVTDRAALQQEPRKSGEEHSESDVWESAVLNAAACQHDKARSIGAILADMGIRLSRHDRASTKSGIRHPSSQRLKAHARPDASRRACLPMGQAAR